MSDIRRLNLEEQKVLRVSSIPREKYSLSDVALQRLLSVIEEMKGLEYWNPTFQAWLPLVETYAQAGGDSAVLRDMVVYLDKKSKLFTPPEDDYSMYYADVLSSRRDSSQELFAYANFADLCDFIRMFTRYTENTGVIRKYLFEDRNYLELFTNLLHAYDGSKGYSKYLAEVVYLYRHCMLEEHPVVGALLDELQGQLNAYVEEFSLAFNEISNFVPRDTLAYEWYCDAVLNAIVSAWTSATDLTYNRELLTKDKVLGVSSRLAENLVSYIHTLPCVHTTEVTQQFVFDALQYAFRPTADLNDPDMIYAFCIPRRYIGSLVTVLMDFFHAVQSGALQRNMIARNKYAYEHYNDIKSPEDYLQSLIHRGFVVRG